MSIALVGRHRLMMASIICPKKSLRLGKHSKHNQIHIHLRLSGVPNRPLLKFD
jgi:hypothetical protein